MGDLGSTPGLERSLREGKGYPFQYSDLENSMDYIVHGVPKSQTPLSDFHFHIFFYLLSVTRCYLNFFIASTPVCMLHLQNECNCAYPMWDIAQDNQKFRRHVRNYRDFLSHPVLSLPSSAWAVGVIPGWKAEIPQASWPKTKNKKKYPEHRNNRSNIVTSSIKTLKL